MMESVHPIEFNSMDSETFKFSIKPGNCSIYQASFNFINSIIGAGIIGVPYAIRSSGFFSGIFLVFLIAYFVHQSVLMLIDCGIKHRKFDLDTLSEEVLGLVGTYMSLISMILFSFGAQISYLVIIGDIIPPLTHQYLPQLIAFENRYIVMVITSAFVILPLCLMKNLNSFSFISMLSIISDFLLIIIVVVYSPSTANNQNIPVSSSNDYTFINRTMFAGIGTMSTAFVCQHNSFMVFRSLKSPNYNTWKVVANTSISFALLLILIFGIGGYISFGNFTKADILVNFPEDSLPINIARFLLAICMIFTYPLECYVSRHCIYMIGKRLIEQKSFIRIYDIICKIDRYVGYRRTMESSVHSQLSTDSDNNNSFPNPIVESSLELSTINDNADDIQTVYFSEKPYEESNEPSILQHITITVVLWTVVLSVALVANDLGIVLAITGSVAGSILGYILPSLVFLKSYNDDFLEAFRYNYDKTLIENLNLMRPFFVPISMLMFGILSLIFGVITIALTNS